MCPQSLRVAVVNLLQVHPRDINHIHLLGMCVHDLVIINHTSKRICRTHVKFCAAFNCALFFQKYK